MQVNGQEVEGGVCFISSAIDEEVVTKKTVKEVVRDYWGNVVVLLDWVMDDRLVEYEVLRVVYEIVDELNIEVGIQEVYGKLGICSDFWVVYEEGRVAVGYIERDGVEAQIFVNCEREILLITVCGEWNGYKWKVSVETGKGVETNFDLRVRL